jgi:sarcosine oxidase subunit beta
MSGDEARARWPWLPDSVRSARFRQRDGLIQPRRITLGLLEGCDARVALGCDVTGFDVEGGRLAAVRTDRGTIACGGAVIAAGPLSGRVAELAGVELPVRPLRRQRVILWDAPEIPQDAPMTIDEETTAHWRPVAPGGAYVLFPDPAEPYAPPLDVVPGDPALALRLLDPDSPVSVASTGRFWNDLWQRGGRSWTVQAGQYTMTPDQRPLIGASEVDGLWVNTGYNGHGVMAGPGGAELLASLIAGRSAESPFRLDRTFVEAHQAF